MSALAAAEVAMCEPRIRVVPEGHRHPKGDAVLELVDACGINLDDWQQDVLLDSLLVRDDGLWAAREIGLMISRQNGKSELGLARILGGLYVLDEPLIVYTAHLADTAKEMFRRLHDLTESKSWLKSEVKHVWRTNGHESIELNGGRRVRFRTRTKGGGRGYAGVACVLFDEAMDIPTTSHGSIMPIVSAVPNAQVLYMGSAVDQLEMEDGIVFANVRARALDGRPSLLYVEYSIGKPDGSDYDSPSAVPREVLASEGARFAANPAYRVRITKDAIDSEAESMIPRTLAVERFGVGDWPRVEIEPDRKIDPAAWRELTDPRSKFVGDVCIAYDVSPERSSAISLAGRRADGNMHVEVVDSRPGTRWVVARLAELDEDLRPLAVVRDKKSPAGSLDDEVEQAGVKIEDATASEHAYGCGQLVDLIDEERIRHLGTDELNAAIAGASSRPLGDQWVWARQASTVNIAPLVSVTLAVWGFGAFSRESEPMVSFR